MHIQLYEMVMLFLSAASFGMYVYGLQRIYRAHRGGPRTVVEQIPKAKRAEAGS